MPDPQQLDHGRRQILHLYHHDVERLTVGRHNR